MAVSYTIRELAQEVLDLEVHPISDYADDPTAKARAEQQAKRRALIRRRMRDELTQVAAVAVAWLEGLEAEDAAGGGDA